jgi:signal transduction histidine kinase
MALRHKVSNEVISTGIPDLDAMLGPGGIYRGTSVLMSGTAGTGKTSFASAFARSACERGERALYFAFEESPDQIARNMESIGIDLKPQMDSGRLRIVAQRPFLHGLEMHLVATHKEVNQFRPSVVIVDPISNLIAAGNTRSVNAMLTLLIDFLKTEGITAFLTVLTQNGERLEATELGISSIIDTWLLARDIEISDERNRALYLLKSRGMPHSNQIQTSLRRAQKQADRMGHLLDRMLDVSQMASGKLELDLAPCDLSDVVKDVVERLSEEASKAACELRLTLGRGIVGHWDRFRLDEALSNVISNAIKYGAGHPIDIQLQAGDEKAVVVVEDHGIGIAPDDLSRIFGRFERTIASKNYGGLGPGLYMTRQIVEQHRGSITAENRPCGGARFVIEIPLVSNTEGLEEI